MSDIQSIDPRGLFQDSYRIEGIVLEQCRSIFMDWALGSDLKHAKADMQALLDHYGPDNPDHPMTQVLREGLSENTGLSDGRRRTGRRPGRHPGRERS